MSANLDLVGSIYSDWARGDFSANDWADAGIEFSFADGPEPASSTGLAGMSAVYGDFLEAWEGFRAEPEEYIVIDDERILVLVRNGGRGRVSGLELQERSVANLFHVRAGKVCKLVLYMDREHAFEDSGLPPGGSA